MYKYLVLFLISVAAHAEISEPYKIPLNTSLAATIAQPKVMIRAADKGVGVEYFIVDDLVERNGYKSGLVGLVVADAMQSAWSVGPLKTARTSADAIAKHIDREEVYRLFQDRLASELPHNALFKRAIELGQIPIAQKVEAQSFDENVVLALEIDYELSVDLRYLHISGTAQLFDKSKIQPPPAKKSKSKDKAGNEHPEIIYRNRYEYFSDKRDPAPERNKASVDAAILAIRAKYPASLDNFELRQFRKEAVDADKPIPSSVCAEYVVAEWLANDASILRAKLSEGTTEIVKLMVRDIGDTATSNDNNLEKTVIEKSNDRVIVTYGAPNRGSLGSEPSRFAVLKTNGVKYSEKFEVQVQPEQTSDKNRKK